MKTKFDVTKILKKLKLTQEEFALFCGVKQNLVSYWKRNDTLSSGAMLLLTEKAKLNLMNFVKE